MRTLKNIFLFLFIVFAIPVIAQPVNDNPCNAVALPVGAACTYTQYTNAGATASAGVPAPGCGNYSGGDVWFSAVVPASGTLIFDSNTGVMTDGGMAIYTGPCGALTLAGCDDDGSANGLMPSISQTGLTPGTTVFIRFWEFGNNNNGTFSICAKAGVPCTAQGANSSCALADPFCTGVSTDYCNTTNVPSLGGAGIYGCLLSTPNPAFYYVNIATSGNIIFNISQQTAGGVGIDVDFVIWGPFASQAAMCAGITAGNIVSCSYSTAAIETATIPGAVAGQWYMVLITNFSNQTGVINFNQTNTGQPGAGATNCNILTAIPSACAGGTYTISGNVIVPAPPATGTLTITNSCGGNVVLNAPFTSPVPYSIPTLLCGNGLNCNVTAVFSAAGAPIVLPTTYTAPNCNTLTAVAAPCIGNTYVMSGTLTVGAACLPATGTLTITSSCGGSVVINAPFSSPQNWSLPPSTGNGGSCTITAVYSAAGAPIITPIVVVEPTCCPANTGTFTVTQTNGTQTTLANGTTQVVLCPGGSVNIVSNNNYTLPPSGCFLCLPELMYAIYTSAGPTGPNPNIDPNWTGYYWTGQDFTTANSGGISTNSAGGCSPLLSLPAVPGYASPSSPTNTLVFVPITADDGDNDGGFSLGHDQNNDGCFDLGNPVSVTFLNPITFTPISNCSSGSVSIDINGGYPQFFPALYTITNTGAGTLSSTSVSSGGNVTISGLTAGQTFSFSVNSGNGCPPSTFSGVYSGPPTVSINPSTASVCVGGCVNLLSTINSGVGNGNLTFTSNQCANIPDGGIGINANGTPGVVGGNWAQRSITVSGVCDPVWNTGDVLIVCLNILHTWDEDLNIYLQAPNGVYYLLSRDNGVAGDNYTGTCFSVTAVTNIIAGLPPFAGSFIPQGGVGNFAALNGTPTNGSWTLWVADDEAGDIGTLLNWSITLANQNNYTYAWSPTVGLSSTNTTNPIACPTSSTTYTLTVTNTCGCTATATAAITVNPPPVVIVNPLTICLGQSGVLTATGATTYTWSPSTGLSASTGGTVTASPTISTTYTVTGTVSVGCSGTATSVVTVNPQPIVVVLPLIICNGQSGALTATGATTYTWSPSTGLSATTGATVNANPTTTTVYTVIGTAANGCTNSTTVTVTVNPIPSVTSALPSYSICSGPTLATASSPIINLFPNPAGTTIAWTGSDGSSGTGTPISYLIPNNTCADILITYTVTPTFNGCVGTPLIIPLIVRPKPIATFTVAPNPICVGQIAVVTFVGTACPGSTYAWTWPANVTVLSGTGAGPYTVNFAAAATYNISLQITGPVALGACLSPLVTVPVIVNPLPSIGIPFVSICNGQSVIVGANGASSYVWSPSTGLSVTTGASVLVNPTITTTYTIIGTSAVGCTAQTICIVTVNTAPILSTTFISPSCFGGANGSINLILTGGTAPFSYLWNTGALTEDLNGIGAGIYTVTVTSTGGCTVTTSVTVTQPTAISNSFVTTNILCNGASTGAIDLTPSGGVSLYSYLWSTGAVTQDLTNVVAGTYIVTVTDANGCTKQDGIILIQSLPVVINVPPATICSGQSGALTATGATTYTWSPSTGLSATTGATVNANPTITSTYTIIGTNVSGCTGTTTAVVTIYPLPIITPAHTDATCGNANGTASVSVSSGTPGFSYLWSNGSTLAAIGGLLAGNYSITVTDVNSCTSTVTISINNSGGPTLIPTPVPIACNGGNNGSVSITVSNGTTPFTYLWSNGATTQNISGLTAGSYSVTVTDANNCIATGTTNLTQPLPLLIILSPINVTCNGGINGSVSSTVSGGTPLYSYAWSNGATTTAINTLGSGTYSVTITDGNGCTATSTTTVIDPPTLDVSLLVVDPSCGLNNGSILVDAIVGVAGPYSYLWSNGETGIGITNLGPVSYSVTVTGANGCTGTEIALLVSTLPATATTSQVNVLCNGGATASIDLSVTGWLTFSYNWSNGTTTQDLLNLPVGVYAVTVTASNGCTATANATITQPTAIIPSSTSINTTCGNSNGSIDLTVSGGTPGYNYIWSNGATTQDITTIAAGTYTVTITDANGCTATTSATLTNAANPTANASATAVTCNGGTNGAVTLVVNSGTPPYTFNWSNGALTQNLANLVAGTYTVTVTDVNGCTVTTNATVTQPTAIPPSTTNVTICQNQLPYTWNTQILNSAGTYSVTLVNSSGCDSVAILNLTVTPLITPVFATPIGPFCQNSAAPVLPLISDNGINGTWNPSSINTASVGTSTYTFTPTVGQCAVPTSITITILPQIIPTFPPVSPLCFGDPSPILPTTSLEGITGTWSPSTVSNTATGTYVFTPDNPSQCGTTTIITVTVDPLPLTTPIYHD